MVIGQRVVDDLDERLRREDLISHLVHGVLHTGAVILCEGLEGDVSGGEPGGIEAGPERADLVDAAEALPVPVAGDIGAEDAVPGLLESGVLITNEAPELRVGALEDLELVDAGLDVDTLALDDIDVHVARLLAVLVERVRVRLAVDVHARPAVRHDVGVHRVDVPVAADEVLAQDGPEQLGRRHGVLAGRDVDSILDRVGRDHHTVVRLGVAVCVSF